MAGGVFMPHQMEHQSPQKTWKSSPLTWKINLSPTSSWARSATAALTLMKLLPMKPRSRLPFFLEMPQKRPRTCFCSMSPHCPPVLRQQVVYLHLIKWNTTVPTKNSEIFSTYSENHESRWDTTPSAPMLTRQPCLTQMCHVNVPLGGTHAKGGRLWGLYICCLYRKPKKKHHFICL